MPYRRLPNTDVSRLNALKTAKNVSLINGNSKAISSSIVYDLGVLLPIFEQNINQYKASLEKQKENKINHTIYFQKCKLYISHFIQVLNFAIARNEFDANIRIFYGLNNFNLHYS